MSTVGEVCQGKNKITTIKNWWKSSMLTQPNTGHILELLFI